MVTLHTKWQCNKYLGSIWLQGFLVVGWDGAWWWAHAPTRTHPIRTVDAYESVGSPGSSLWGIIHVVKIGNWEGSQLHRCLQLGQLSPQLEQFSTTRTRNNKRLGMHEDVLFFNVWHIFITCTTATPPPLPAKSYPYIWRPHSSLLSLEYWWLTVWPGD